MKSNYKTTDKVIVTNKSHFASGLPGTVLSNNTDTKFKPLSIILDNGLGSWMFNYSDVELIGKEKASSKEIMPWEEKETTIVKVAGKAGEKRAYNKKSKDQPVKTKRSYNKKTKS